MGHSSLVVPVRWSCPYGGKTRLQRGLYFDLSFYLATKCCSAGLNANQNTTSKFDVRHRDAQKSVHVTLLIPLRQVAVAS